MVPAFLATMLADKGLELLSGLFYTGSKAVIDKAADYVKDKTGINLATVPNLTPEHAAELHKFEQLYAKDLLAMQYADIVDARAMQKVALQQEDKLSKQFIYYFAGVWSLFAMAYVLSITFLAIPEASIRYADTILGFMLGTVIATILQFFFGSSMGSKEKDKVK